VSVSNPADEFTPSDKQDALIDEKTLISCKVIKGAQKGMYILITNFSEDGSVYFKEKEGWNIFYSEKSPICLQYINSGGKKFECKGLVEINPYDSPEMASKDNFVYKFIDSDEDMKVKLRYACMTNDGCLNVLEFYFKQDELLSAKEKRPYLEEVKGGVGKKVTLAPASNPIKPISLFSKPSQQP
jgi:hypothetical protein